MVETSTLFDLTIEGVTTTVLVTLPALSWLYAKRHPEANREIVKTAENIEYELPKHNSGVFERKAAYYCALLLAVFTLFSFFVLYQRNATITDYIIHFVLILTIFMCLPRTLGSIYDLKKNKKALLFWTSSILASLIAATSLVVMILVNSVYVFLISIKLIIVSLLISERFFRLDKKPFKDYLTSSIGKASILYVAITICGSLIIFLFSGLTFFILSEIAGIILIVSIPFISRLKIDKNKCNDKLLLIFARSIEQ
jgi:hypothetical protein